MATEQELLGQITALHQKVGAIWDAADARKAEGGDDALSTTDYQTVIDSNKEIERLEKQVAEMRDARKAQADARAAHDRRAADMRQPVNALGPGGKADAPAERRTKTTGQTMLGDAGFVAWREQQLMGGGVSSAKFGSSPRVAVKALIASADVSGTQFYGMPGPYMGQPLNLRALITVGTTDQNSVDFVREGTFVNAAATVAAATASGDGSGAKPESSMAYSMETASAKIIAHWIPIPRSVLADAAQLELYADNFLRYGVEQKLESQIMGGAGTGTEFLGIRNTTGIQTQAWDTDMLTTLRRGRTKVRVTGRATPSAYVLHPNDWEDIDLLKDNEGRYYYGGPSIIGQPRLWGLPVVESESETEGYGHVAEWRQAVLLDREQAQVFMSDSHQDFFTRNLIAMLGELRAVFFVLKPAAFVECDLTA